MTTKIRSHRSANAHTFVYKYIHGHYNNYVHRDLLARMESKVNPDSLAKKVIQTIQNKDMNDHKLDTLFL